MITYTNLFHINRCFLWPLTWTTYSEGAGYVEKKTRLVGKLIGNARQISQQNYIASKRPTSLQQHIKKCVQLIVTCATYTVSFSPDCVMATRWTSWDSFVGMGAIWTMGLRRVLSILLLQNAKHILDHCLWCCWHKHTYNRDIRVDCTL